MRTRIAAGVVLAGLGAWIAAGVLTTPPPTAGAQTPTVELNRVQRAGFVPRTDGNGPLFVLAIGSDARPGERVDRRLADSVHLIAVNADRGAATILGFPRDSYVRVPGVGNRKINDSLYEGGVDLVVRTVEDVTGIPIDYYLLTGFEGMKALVNEIGGLSVEVPYPMSDPYSGASFEAGVQEMDGGDALAFARNRYDTPDGDFSRSLNHGILLLSALEKLRSEYEKDPAVLFRWIAAAMTHLQTDLELGELLDLSMTALQVDPGKVLNTVLPGRNTYVGEAAVVELDRNVTEIFRDLGDDGLLSG